MSLLDRLAQTRLNQITSHARDYLASDEHIVRWVRAKNPQGRGEGFVYLTDKHCIIHWRGRSQGPGAIALQDVTSWGLDREASGGPILGIEAGDQVCYVQLPVTTKAMAEHATSFVAEFADLAPEPASEFTRGDDIGEFSTDGGLEVSGAARSWKDQFRRVGLTTLGIALVIFGVALLVLPGPGILVLLAGLAVLGSEYDWAKDVLDWTRQRYKQTRQRMKSHQRSRD